MALDRSAGPRQDKAVKVRAGMDNTRIYGSGGGWKGDTGERRSPARGDVGRFRAAHSVGDVVRGVFLRQEDTNTGWVDLDGEQLLAQLPETGPRPLPGEMVFFRIDTLSPEVTLRFLGQGSGGAAAHLPLSMLAASYSAARERLDGIARERLWPDWKNLPSSGRPPAREAYCQFAGRNEVAFAAYAEAKVYAAALEKACAGAGVLAFRHMPWLMPEARAVETALLQKGRERRLLAGALLPFGRHLLMDGLLLSGPQNDGVLFRLAVADAGAEFPLPSAASVSRGSWRCFSVERTTAGTTDIIAALLALRAGEGAHSGQGGFARKV